MNRRERELLARMYEVLNRLTTYAPSNPADIKRHVQASGILRHEVGEVALVLSSIGYGDYAEAAEALTDLEDRLDARDA